jgi:hypothetical protein
MDRRAPFTLAWTLAALLAAAAPGLAQEDDGPLGGDGLGLGDDEEAQIEEVKGFRYTVKLKNGATVEGVLPGGLVWEKLDRTGEFVSATEKDKDAGIRLFYILNLEGEFFIKRGDIATSEDTKDLLLRNLGALTAEQKAAIRERLRAQKRKVIEAREKAVQAELAKIAKEEEEAKSSKEDEEEGGEEKPSAGAKSTEDADAKKGDDLLERYPPPEWGQKKILEILDRETTKGLYRTDSEREFIDGFKLWKAALDRKIKAEVEKGAKEGEKEGEKPAPADGKK